MKISGFTMVKNADKLYYPIKAAIASILPIVDEFVVTLGDCDADDKTREEILSLNSPKVKIIDTVWDTTKYPNGMENAHQTDIAKEACSGDWLFYLQADEVVHEKYFSEIVDKCTTYLNDKNVEALLFKYKHFWGDYGHFQNCHGWYPKEIRIIRNRPDIHSWESAQSFRRIPGFDKINYRQQKGTFKLKTKELDAYIFHYGWVRPPHYMQSKRIALDTIHKGSATVAKMDYVKTIEFDYGPLRLAEKYEDSHPEVMEEWIAKFDWADKLYEQGPVPKTRKPFKHERLKYQILTFFEKTFNKGEQWFTFKNYESI